MLKKLLACVLSLALIFCVIPLNVSAETVLDTNYSEYSDHGDIIQPESEAEVLYEITEKRDANTKHFAMSDGTIKACVYPETVHYKKDGKYLDIDNTLIETVVDGKTYHQNIANSFKTKFPTNSQEYIEFSDENGYVKFKLVGALNKSIEKVQKAVEKAALKKDKTVVKNNHSHVVYKSVKANIDIEYDVTGSKLKETIVLNKKSKQSYVFEILTSAASAIKNNDNSICFFDGEGVEIYTIQSPYMVDAANEYSNSIVTTLTKTDTGYTLTYTPDYEWLSAKERVYPVRIDPTFVKPVDKNSVIDTFVYTNQDSANERGDYDVINVGKRTSGLITRGFIKFDLPSDIGDNDTIVKARLYLTHYDNNSTVTGTQIDVHKLTESFNELGTIWSNQPQASTVITDYTLVKSAGLSFTDSANNVYTYDSYDFTTLAGEWHRGSSTNYGIMLKLHDESATLSSNKQVFYHSKDSVYFSTVSKFVEITYRNTTGLENYWSYFTKDLGQYGTSSVNNYNGNLVYIHNDASFSSLINGVTLSHVYNSNLSSSGTGRYGNGWGLNLVQTLKATTIEGNPAVKFVYTDGDGTKHFLIQTDDNSIKDEDGLGLTYTNNSSADSSLVHKLTDKDKNVYLFDTKGYLRKIIDTNNNVINLNYTSISSTDGYLSSITTSSGGNIVLNYSNSKLVSITDNAERTTLFNIDANGNLIKITYPDNSEVALGYDGKKLNSITTPGGQKLSYIYTNGRVSSAKTIGNQDATLDHYLFEYDNRQTVITEKRPNGEVKNKYTYQFDSYGRVICVYDKNLNVYSQSYTAKSTESNNIFKNNKISTESNSSVYVNNLLSNGTFKSSMAEWHKYNPNHCTFEVVTNQSLLSTESIHITNHESALTSAVNYVTVTPGKQYTMSGYIKTVNVEAEMSMGAGLEIVTTKDRWHLSDLIRGTTDTSINNGFEKISVTFTLDADENIKYVTAGLYYATGTVYIDSVQLEEGDTANPINLVRNSSFEKNNGNATLPSGFSSDQSSSVGGCQKAVKYDGGQDYTMRVIGNNELDASIYQTINVSGKAGDVYSFGGWAKANSIPQHLETGYISSFEISAKISYADGTVGWSNNPFNTFVSDWQYVQKSFIAEKDYTKIDLYCSYNHNCNYAFFDNLFLYRDTMQSYTYDSNGNVVSTADYASQNSSYIYNNNNLSKMISPTGSGYEYLYDTKNQVISSRSSEGLQYSFSYDSNGNPTDTVLSSNSYSSSIESGKTYYIRLKSRGKYLTVENASTANNANVVVSEFTGNANQRWKIEKANDGMFYLYPEHATNMVLEVTNGVNEELANVAIATQASADKQKWTIISQDDLTYVLYPNSSPSKKILTVNFAYIYDNVSILSLQSLNNQDQEWYFEEVESNPVNSLVDGGIYQFRNLYSGKYIDADNPSTDVDTTVSQKFMSLGESQRYLVTKYGSTDYYTLTPINDAGKLIEVSTATDSDGYVYLKLGDSTVTDYKLFKFEYNSAKQGFVIVPKINDSLSLLIKSANIDNRVRYILGIKSTESYFTFVAERFSETINSSATYQDNGNFPHTVTDSRGNTTTYEYDYETGLQTGVTDANGVTTEYNYNGLNDRLETVTSSGKTVSYMYNADGTLKNITSPSGTVYNFDYDQFGRNVKISVGSSVLSRTEYLVEDPLLVSKMIYGNSVERSYGYDQMQRLISESVNNNVIKKYTYDKLNNIAEINDLVTGYKTNYSYDLTGRIIGIKLSNGQNINYTYDNFNRVSMYKWSLEDILFKTQYVYGSSAVSGQKTGLIYGVKLNGTEKIGYSYDDLVRLKTRTLKTTTPFVTQYGYLEGAKAGTTTTLIKTVKNGNDTLEYAYDVLGNITQIKKNGIVVESYTYDSLNQLKTVTRGSDVWEYTYDNGGNILSVTKNGTAIKTYGYTDTEWKDKMTSFNGQTITYDAIGNPLQYRDGFNFTWANGRQLSTVANGTNTYSYNYDADGLRTSKTVNGTTTNYYWANGVLQAQKTGSEYIVFLYDENGSAYGLLLKNGTTEEYYYYVYNAQGDVIGIVDSYGTKVVEYTYGAWGEILSTTGTLASTIGQSNPLRYRGYYYDAETGFYYLQSRYYDTTTQRFLNADAYVSTGQGILGNNMFAYCINNPINCIDSTGQIAIELYIIIEVAIVLGTAIVGTAVLSDPNVQQSIESIAVGAINGIEATIDMFSTLFSKPEEKAEEKDIVVPSQPKNNAKRYYHVTSFTNAQTIASTGKILSGEGGYVYAWKSIPNKGAMENSGARYYGKGTVVIAFETIAAFETDPTVNRKTYMYGPVRSCFPGDVSVNNVMIVRYN